MEKNILAFFDSPEEAEGAARKLRALRAIDVGIDRFSGWPEEGAPGAGTPGESVGILAAADIGAGGMSDGGQGGPTGRGVILTAVVDESIHQQALRVIEQAGGRI